MCMAHYKMRYKIQIIKHLHSITDFCTVLVSAVFCIFAFLWQHFVTVVKVRPNNFYAESESM